MSRDVTTAYQVFTPLPYVAAIHTKDSAANFRASSYGRVSCFPKAAFLVHPKDLPVT